jgi:hypothetical protein
VIFLILPALFAFFLGRLTELLLGCGFHGVLPGMFRQRLVAATIAANLRSAIAPASCKYNPSLTVSQSDFEVDDDRFWHSANLPSAPRNVCFEGAATVAGATRNAQDDYLLAK